MDAPMTAAIAATNTINSLVTPTNRRFTKLTTLTPTWPKTTSKLLCLFRDRTSSTFLTSCSSKANTGKTSATNENLTSDSSSDSRIENGAKPSKNRAVSSSNSAYSRGLVFDLGPKTSWDGLEIGSPVVKRYLSDEEERWYMWYHGRSTANPGVDLIGLAVSSNGIHWERGGGPARSSGDVGLVMNCSQDWWSFDTQSIRPCEVVIMSSSKVRANAAVYWLYYTGFSSEKIDFSDNSLEFSLENPERVHSGSDENGGNGKFFRSLPGLAISQDGRHWARIEGGHHSGALFDVGSNGEWDSLFIASPQVVFHGNGDLRMYYHSFDVEKGHFAVGIARSRDGIKWLKLGKILGRGGGNGAFDEYGMANARVVRNRKDGMYLMVYEGVAADGRRSIGFAVSSDGLKNWKRLQDCPVIEKSEDGWDNEGVGSPCLVQMDGDEDEWRLYYKGIGKEGKTGIGMAVSKGNDFTSFRRSTGFHL